MAYRNFQSISSHGGDTVEELSVEEDKGNLQDWILIIKHVVARDSGSYECQVSISSFLYKGEKLSFDNAIAYMVLLLVLNISLGHYRYR